MAAKFFRIPSTKTTTQPPRHNESDDGYTSAEEAAKSTVKKMYSIRSLIKQSSHAQIYNAVDRKTNQKVILKRYLKSHFETKELYFTEMAYRICPEYCLPVSFKQDDKKYFTFVIPKYGMSLYDFMIYRGTVLNLEESKFVFQQVLKCLIKLQNVGLYHLDIKEENILIDPKTFNIKIIDFGCSSELPIFTKKIVGSKEFCSPEIISGESHYTNVKKHDVWSLGVTIISAMTGNTPYNKIEDIMTGEEDFEILADIDEIFDDELKGILGLMLDLDPERRVSFRKLAKTSFFGGC